MRGKKQDYLLRGVSWHALLLSGISLPQQKIWRNCKFKCTKFIFGSVVTKVSKLFAAVHRRDLDLLVSAGGGGRKGGAGAAGHLHLITASASRWWRLRHVGLLELFHFRQTMTFCLIIIGAADIWCLCQCVLSNCVSSCRAQRPFVPHFLGWILNFLTRRESAGRNGSMYKAFERSQGNIDVQLPK